MKNKNKYLLLLALPFLLLSCSKPEEPVEPPFDENIYDQVVEEDVAVKWVEDSINNIKRLNAVQINTEVKNLETVQNSIEIPNSATEKPSGVENFNEIKLSYKETTNTIGLQSKNPNDIQQTSQMSNIKMNARTSNLDPLGNDTAELENGAINTYIYQNKNYTDLSDKKVEEFLPNLLFLSGKYETIYDARRKAKEVPLKSYNPDPIFKEENLPLIDNFTSFKGVTIVDVLNKLIEQNNKEETKFLTFMTNGENLKVTLKFDKDFIIKVALYINEINGEKQISNTNLQTLLNNSLEVTSFQFDIAFNEDRYLAFEKNNIDMEFSFINLKQKPYEFTTIALRYLSESKYNFDTPAVIYPNDLNSYVEYKVDLPSFKPTLPDINL